MHRFWEVIKHAIYGGTLLDTNDVGVIVHDDALEILMPPYGPDDTLTDTEGYLVAAAMIWHAAKTDGDADKLRAAVMGWLDDQIATHGVTTK